MAEDTPEKRAEANKGQDAQAAIMAGFIGVPLVGLALHKVGKAHINNISLGGLLGTAAKHAGIGTAKALGRMPLDFTAGVVSDRNARANPSNYSVLQDAGDKELWSGATSAWKDYGEKVKEHKSAESKYRNAESAWEKKMRTLLKEEGDPIASSSRSSNGLLELKTKSGKPIRPHVDDDAKTLLGLRDSVSNSRAVRDAALTTRNKAIKDLPYGSMARPTALIRGLRGAVASSEPNLWNGGLVSPLRVLSRTAGRSVPYLARTLPRVGLGIAKDLMKGTKSTIVRAAKISMIAKMAWPLKDAAYHSTLGSEDRYNGNPMLSGLANSMSSVPMTQQQEEQHYARMSPSSSARQRFIESSQGLALDLSKVAGRI